MDELRHNRQFSVTELLLTNSCLLCGATDVGELPLCVGCRDDLPAITHACSQCGLPLSGGALLCGGCLNQPPHYDHATIPLLYAHPIDQLVQALKFNGRLSVATLFGRLLLDEIVKRGDRTLPQRIIPVPLHPTRLRERGFNQSLEIARPIARTLGIPLDARSCRRVRATASQSSLSARERRKNIRNAFEADELKGVTSVAIVDDVVTTGNTVNELAGVLRKAGVEEVEVWACARAD